MATIKSRAWMAVCCGITICGCGRPGPAPTETSAPPEQAEASLPAEEFLAPEVGVVAQADTQAIVQAGGKDFKVRGTFRMPPGKELDNEDFVVQIFDEKRITHDTAMAFAESQEDGTYAYETTIQSPLKPGTFSLESWHEGQVVVAAPLTVE
jgi:hypothetical protein